MGVLLEPFLPFASEKIRATLNVSSNDWTWSHATKRLPVGHTLGPAPDVLFKKLDIKEFELK
jgi:methionyl-tRNA synthetase